MEILSLDIGIDFGIICWKKLNERQKRTSVVAWKETHI